MLKSLVDWSIHNRLTVVVLAALLLGLGLYAAANAKLDVFPEFAPPQVVVQTEAPGLSPTEVEQLVTLPIETSIGGVPGLDILRSQSIQGLSVVTAVFQDKVDVYRARQLVAERVAEVTAQLPEGAKAARLAPLTATTGRLISVGFTSEKLSPMQLRDFIQWTIRPRLLAVSGVAQVTLYGGEQRQLQVQVHRDRLAARNLTLTDVLDATRQASSVRGSGFMENDRQRITLRTEAQVRTAEELSKTPIMSVEGTPVHLAEVARVVDAAAPKFGDATVNGVQGVILVVFRQIDGDTPAITRRVEAEIERFQPAFERQGIVCHPALFRQANFIEHAVGNVTRSLLLGAMLVAVVLFVFLFNLRTALISLTAIPLSLLGAVAVLWGFGVGLNTLTLGGLAIAVGEVVDDAVIDVENIFRRLRENARAGHPRSAAAIVLSASLEVRSAVVYATFIVVLVFIPVFFLSGVQGRLFAPLGYAYALAVLASLLVALTVTPALAMTLLPRAGGAEEPPLLRRLQGGYDRLLRRLLTEFPLLLTTGVLLVAGAVWALRSFGGEFLPELRESHFVVHMRGVPGTSLRESVAAGAEISRRLASDSAVLGMAHQVGRAELGEDTTGVETSELEVDLRRQTAVDAERSERRLKETLAGVPGYSFEVLSFLSERIKETLSGTHAAVAVKLYGDELTSLDEASATVAKALAAVPGSASVLAEPQTGTPELVVRVRQGDAARFGLRNAQVLEAVHASFQGAEVGQVYDRNRTVSVVVVLDPAARTDVGSVADLWLSTPADTTRRPAADSRSTEAASPTPGRIQLKQVADVFLADGRFLIAHEGGTRRRQVTCNVEGRDVESFVATAERRLKSLVLPDGVTYAVSGEHEAKRAAQRELLLLSAGVGVGILLLLWSAFGSVRWTALVLVNLPFAFVGGVAAVYLSGGVLNVGSLVGFVTLFGITTRNGIMMVSHWQHLRSIEGMPWGSELVLRGAKERLAPVLMTALVTALGLLPIALGSGEAGREIEGPMALVILGGLVTSTALNLLVLPTFAVRIRPPD